MSAFTPIKEREARAKVHHSQYIRTANTPDEAGTNPAEPATPAQPEVK